MIRVAMLSFWHVHARNYAEWAQSDPNTEIVVVWDETPERDCAEARAYLARRWYTDIGCNLWRSTRLPEQVEQSTLAEI